MASSIPSLPRKRCDCDDCKSSRDSTTSSVKGTDNQLGGRDLSMSQELPSFSMPGPPASLPPPAPPSPSLRQGTANVCQYCRRRKIRCAGFETSPDGRCTNCQRFQQECNFTPVSSSSQWNDTTPAFAPGTLATYRPPQFAQQAQYLANTKCVPSYASSHQSSNQDAFQRYRERTAERLLKLDTDKKNNDRSTQWDEPLVSSYLQGKRHDSEQLERSKESQILSPEEPNSHFKVPTSIGKKEANRVLEQNVGEGLAEEPRAARRASLTFPENPMSKIRNVISSGLDASLPTHFANFLVYWDLRTFMQQQYKDSGNGHVDLGPVITLSGSAIRTQATTCAEYMRQTWPASGVRNLNLICDALLAPGQIAQTKHRPWGSIKMEFRSKCCFVNLDGVSKEAIIDLAQQLAWMGAAFQASVKEHIELSDVSVRLLARKDLNASFEFAFENRVLPEKYQSCWYPLFSNPVIANRFPIPERANNELGLEIPMEIMAALAGARYAMEFDGGVVIKGVSAVFIPTKRTEDIIQWHLIRVPLGTRIKYEAVKQCPKRALLHEVDHASIQSSRAILGWWSLSEMSLGTDHANYADLDWSPAPQASRSAKLSGGALGFSYLVTGQLNFSAGAKDGRMTLSHPGPFRMTLHWAEKTTVVLYDYDDRRSWLVPALDVIMHILRTRHHRTPFQLNGNYVDLSSATSRTKGQSLKEMLAQNASQTVLEDRSPEKPNYCLQDAIVNTWAFLERLMEKDELTKSTRGLDLRDKTQSSLYGWEFMALVEERNIRHKHQYIAKTHGGWLDLAKDIDSVVLFGTGFGEVIKPVSQEYLLCRQWRNYVLPQGKDYLAVECSLLEILYEEAGSRKSRQHLTSTRLQWHCTSPLFLFGMCQQDRLLGCSCSRLQQLFYDSATTFGIVGPPKILPRTGCIAFGQAHHPLTARKTGPHRVNAVHILPNFPLEQTSNSRPCSPSQAEAIIHDDNTESESIPDDEVALRSIQNRQRSISSGLEDCTPDSINIEPLHLKALAGNEISEEQPRAGETHDLVFTPALKLDSPLLRNPQDMGRHSRRSVDPSPMTKSTKHSAQQTSKNPGQKHKPWCYCALCHIPRRNPFDSSCKPESSHASRASVPKGVGGGESR